MSMQIPQRLLEVRRVYIVILTLCNYDWLEYFTVTVKYVLGKLLLCFVVVYLDVEGNDVLFCVRLRVTDYYLLFPREKIFTRKNIHRLLSSNNIGWL